MQPATSSNRRRLDIVATIGLGVGAILGLAGTLVESDSVRQACWGLDGVALVVATAILSVRYLRRGDDCVAAGFLVFAMGESLLVSGTAAGLGDSVPSFGGGVALWAAALLMTSIPRTFAGWVRAAGLVAAALFAVVAARIFWGEPLLPTASPLPFFGYPFVVLTFAGWAWTLLTDESADGEASVQRSA